MSRALKKLSFQYQYLKLELEEIQEELDQLQQDWSSRFGKYFVQEEVEMWMNTETGELSDKPPTEPEPKEQKPEKLKKVYRKLSTILHPDKGGTEEKFTELKQAYESNDIIELVNIAAENNIEIDLTEDDIELMMKSINSVNKSINEKQMTMIWQYYKGGPRARKAVISQIQSMTGKEIDPKDLED